MKARLQKLVQQTVEALFSGVNVTVQLESPQNPAHGDFATNVAMVLAGQVKQKPRDVALQIKDHLASEPDFLESISIAGPGFINFKLKNDFLIKALKPVHDLQEKFGQSQMFKGRRALVEFVSANPTGPLHIGHGRNAVVGDSLARLLKAVGYEVEREYYINDGGIQISTLGKSVYARFRELLGEKIVFPENGYQGDYIRDLARTFLARKDEFTHKSEAELIEIFGRTAGNTILEQIKEELGQVGVVFDHYFSESCLYRDGDVGHVLKDLHDQQTTYEEAGALWLKSTAFGDDKDRVLIKNDGSHTYLTPDIAYHRRKYKKGYDLLVNIWGGDHAGYAPRLYAALKALGYDTTKLHILFIQMVSLIRGGETLSMSTRRAEYETLANVVHEVGPDVARYFFLMRSHQAQLDFDLALAKKESSENPAYYIQYAHARICSIFAKAQNERNINAWPAYEDGFSGILNLPEEVALASQIGSYAEVLQHAASELAPHRVAPYALELARSFQSYYDKARHDESYKVLGDDALRSKAKLFLLGCVRQVLQNALEILGVSAPEKM